MALKDKYADVILAANSAGVANLQATEQEGVLYVTGTAPSATAKDQVWTAFEKLDPEYSASDIVLNISLAEGAAGQTSEYVVKSGDSLSKIAKNYPGVTWKEIFEANKDQIKDPNLIHPGQKLKIPS
ncbi:LysM peptidoglycan-binding domain-containing protein [Chitinophaga horti]|uniref:LysM peptidoglycan-binding domain-containing protein n=1 Tax=Chitinophaga horti TaxID=2920382 RepID=A0ABY6J4B1_9BACT|nr:LysM peptidoglycan-binding domain-containing protein [Chitinophaga horti]UYQ93024.1 LysM peptidoglycan-binding domain-containing protein [Chitinophaga horti]